MESSIMSFASKFQEEKVYKTNRGVASDYLILNLSLSKKEIVTIVESAVREGKKLVLHSVPSEKLRFKMLRYISIAILDEDQLAEITKVKTESLLDIKHAMLRLYGKGVETVIIKMNDKRTLIFENETFSFLEVK
ncbi:carbohydrate kinase family protein [Pedobacter helvus]|uniref:Uncharacterized protein n=1 Tax=Pedobacter helvus TaxID=2563444 RepID=A0ABW9JMI3_9SPHI|nr:hypothetical protein [Pedobacter ureilyticus]